MELGQPTHIFDYDKIPSNNISVRKVKNDKTITTLNIEPGAVFEYYPSNTTITNRNLPTDPARITTARI